MAYQKPEFAAYFAEHSVQLPLAKGDMMLFSPAVFHAGGSNSTDTDRIANLLQISSAFGRTMESIDNRVMIEAVYPILQRRKASGNASELFIRNAIAVVADGYAFPTNLDTDPPIGGNAPETQQQMLWRALDEGWSANRLRETLIAYEDRRRA